MNDVVIYTILALLVAAFLGFISYYKKKDGKAQERVRAPRPRVGEDGAAGGVHPPNRAAANRNARARMRAAAQRRDDDSDEEDDDVAVVGDDIALPDGKLGKKKLAKLQAKADKRAMREANERHDRIGSVLTADEREREERKERAVQAAEDRRREEEREAEEESKREDEERKAREEKERQELEEYMKLKAQFEGEKVVVLEDLAAKFKLKTQDVINRVSELQKEGTLTGVIDDRGKFIYISKQELEGIAKFIKQHGRVSIAELAESSNTLITLTPETSGAS
ncbi:DDRGK domain-containing protein 1-like [Homarus americanus]|uniref:DDRGK domain-containing protein 1 n=1 Tax=Homarus americanus TaxID=6706 RepID=A0A8J5JZR3_HOMAM|nr:DDRGK domain-containing protein 1-like [Homarus americanus]